MHRTYDLRKVLTLGDTNALGNMYFAEYFKLQGTVREQWVRDHVKDGLQLLKDGLVLSTKSAHCEYRRPFYPFDTVLCRMHFEDLRRVRVNLVFEFYKEDTMELHAFGWQTVVFKNKDRRTCSMPDSFRQAVENFVWPTAPGHGDRRSAAQGTRPNPASSDRVSPQQHVDPDIHTMAVD